MIGNIKDIKSFKKVPALNKKNIKNKKNLLISRKLRKTRKVGVVKYRASCYKKFIGLLTKKGNRVAATRILSSALTTIFNKKRLAENKNKVKIKSTIDEVLVSCLRKLATSVEIRKSVRGFKKKKRTTLIPFPVKRSRKMFLRIKWIIEAAKTDSRKVSFSEKLHDELSNLLYDRKKSKAFAKRREQIKLVVSNRSHSHFRW